MTARRFSPTLTALESRRLLSFFPAQAVSQPLTGDAPPIVITDPSLPQPILPPGAPQIVLPASNPPAPSSLTPPSTMLS